MRVKMNVQITGTRNGADWPPAGATIDLPDAEAVDLLNAGLAKAAGGKVEDASDRAPVETAAIKAPAKRRSGKA